jgi:LysM repeat protein
MGLLYLLKSPWRVGMALLLAIVLIAIAVPGASLAAPSERPAASSYSYYTVRHGDTLLRIASRHGVSLYQLMQVNGIYNANHIYVGQVLKIPTVAACAFYHTVKYGQTLSGIAVHYGVRLSALAQANNLSTTSHIYAGQSLCIPGTGGPVAPAPGPGPGSYYVVRPGDTLSAIALRYGTTVHALMSANNIMHPNRILTGQKLFIPGYGYTPPAPPPPPPHYPPKPKPTPTPPPPPPHAVGPWTGLYYNNTDFSGAPAVIRQDPAVNFDWGLGSPAPGIGPTNFSAIWTTTAYFSEGGYRFYALSDDGVRVYVNDQLIIDAWRVQPADIGYFADVYLGAGYHSVRVEYFQAEGVSSIKAHWAKR